MKEETKRWLTKSKDDVIKAKDNLKIKHYDLVSFLCQQSTEKALKSFLIEKTGKFPKIHDLVKLGKLANLEKDKSKFCLYTNKIS
ncbi:MAG: HEPN domain-containing protein [Nanoarchaeota archaeon]|nr:HEPN domain-containing protein [Nanoarchaeota archaeon]